VAPPVPEVRTHVVQEGDSLTRISVRYYGTATRWQEIYDANREVLKGENALRPGQRLRIP
jgi:nucleoid-associated protein YgaU